MFCITGVRGASKQTWPWWWPKNGIIMLMHMWAEKKLSWFAIEIRNKKCVKLPQKLPIGVESKFSNISHVTCYNLAMGSINQSILCHS